MGTEKNAYHLYAQQTDHVWNGLKPLGAGGAEAVWRFLACDASPQGQRASGMLHTVAISSILKKGQKLQRSVCVCVWLADLGAFLDSTEGVKA